MTLTLFAANIAGAVQHDRIAEVIAKHEPDVVVFTEAYHFGQEIPGYDVIRYSRKHGPEARDIVVLVRHGVKIKRRALKKMTRAWWGPFTLRKRAPRRYIVLKVVKDGVGWPVMAVHFPPGGPSGGIKTRGRNKGAWDESALSTRRWLAIRARAVVAGDLNANRAAVQKHVAPGNARVVMASSVDGTVVKGASITARHLPAPKGMHGWFLATYKEYR